MFATAQDAILICDLESAAILEVNEAAQRLFRRTEAELLASTGKSLTHPSSWEEAARLSTQLLADGVAHHPEIRVLRGDGTTGWAEIRLTTFIDDGRALYLSITRDVSERVERTLDLARANRQLEEARDAARRHAEVLDATLGAASDAFLIADLTTGRFLQANPAATRHFGYSLDEFRSMTGRQLHPSELKEAVDAFSAQLLTKGHAWAPRLVCQRKDGSTFWGSVSLSAFELQGQGQFVSVVRDVSLGVARESELQESYDQLRRAQAQLIQASKLSAMGELGAGIAHELNQPIAAISGFAQRMRRRPEDTLDQHLDELDIILKETQRMARIVESVRSFARRGELYLAPIPPALPLENAVALLRRSYDEGAIRLEIDVDQDLPLIQADAGRLQQVFMNLLSNSRDALDEQAFEAERTVRVRVRADADRVQYRITDTGPGVPEAHRAKLFDPFWTTKPPGRGTGLGLSIVFGIVQEHDGDVRYVAGPGACFEIDMPVAAVAEEGA